MEYLLFLAATLLLAVAMRVALNWDRPNEDFGEVASTIFLLWFAVMVGINWTLVALQVMTLNALRMSTMLVCAIALTLLIRHRRRLNEFQAWFNRTKLLWDNPRDLPVYMYFALGALFLCFGYVLVRSLVLGGSVEEFDALSYHFPKAVEVIRARTTTHILSGDFRIGYFPWNYELLLADGMLLAGTDQFSFLIPLATYAGFLASVHALFKRAWPHAKASDLFLSLLLVASTPVLILHITCNKNDVMSMFFLMTFLLWSTVWYLDEDRRSFWLALISLALFFGTKHSALFLGPGLLVLLWRCRSRFRIQALTKQQSWALLAGATLLILLMGAAWPLLNLKWTGHLLGNCTYAGGITAFEANAAPAYGAWSNIWRFPLLCFLKPFGSNDLGVWVFWEHRYYFWPTYRLIYGHYGWLCTVFLALIPFGILIHRQQKGGAAFRRIVTLTILAFVLASLPQQYRVDGMFCGFPRYLLCIPVLVLLWSAVPLLAWLKEKRRPWVYGLTAFGVVGYFACCSWTYLGKDETRSFAAVADRLSDSGPRMFHGVADILDMNAEPQDVIALDGGFGALLYPLYGQKFTRPVHFLLPSPGRPVLIPPDTKWIAIDRSWNAGWSHPGVTTTANFLLPFRPLQTEEDLSLFRQLSIDSGWKLVFHQPQRGQAIFLRVSMAKLS